MDKAGFADKYPKSHKMLLNFFRVPPRRTLVSVAGDWSVVILHQPDNEDLPLERYELPYEPEKIAWALGFLEERRLVAGIKYDPPLEDTAEERARRQAELDASRGDTADETKSPDNIIPLVRQENDAAAQAAAL